MFVPPNQKRQKSKYCQIICIAYKLTQTVGKTTRFSDTTCHHITILSIFLTSYPIESSSEVLLVSIGTTGLTLMPNQKHPLIYHFVGRNFGTIMLTGQLLLLHCGRSLHSVLKNRTSTIMFFIDFGILSSTDKNK